MKTQTTSIPTGATPEIVINARRNLVVQGSEVADQVVAITADQATLNIEQKDGGQSLWVACDKDVTLKVPSNATVRLEKAGGNAEVRQVYGALDIQRVDGSLLLREVGAARVYRLGGNLEAQHVGAALVCAGAGGNANIRHCNGPIEVTAGGNVDLNHVVGTIKANAGGSLTLRVDAAAPELNADLNAGGTGHFHIGRMENLFLNMSAGGSIHGELGEGINATVDVTDHRGARNFMVGKDTARGAIALVAGGSVHLTTHGEAQFDGDAVQADQSGWRSSSSKREPTKISLGSKREVFFDVGIGLRVEGYDGDEIIIEKHSGDIEVKDSDGAVHVECGMDCRALVPNNITLHADVGTDATVRDLDGLVNIDAGASVQVRGVTGQVHVEAGADAKVEFTPQGYDGESSVEAGATAKCWVPKDVKINVQLSDMSGERTQQIGTDAEGPTNNLHIEAGVTARVLDEAPISDDGINIGYIKDRGWVAEMGPEIEKQILEFSSQMTSAANQLAEAVSTIPVPDWLKGEMGDMRKRVEEATRRAQERINRRMETATRRAARRASKAGKRVQINGDFDIDLPFFKKRWEFNTDFPKPPTPSAPPMPPSAPTPPTPSVPPTPPTRPVVTNAERMAILRMLEQKKITAEQAAELLAALGE